MKSDSQLREGGSTALLVTQSRLRTTPSATRAPLAIIGTPVRLAVVRMAVALPLFCGLVTVACVTQPNTTPIIKSAFLYDRAPFPSAHASTIVETSEGLVATWFGGTEEGSADVGIWVSRQDGARWTEPVEVEDGRQPDGYLYPCWNPVLFQPSNGPLLLFYRIGPNPREWWSLVRTSIDRGRTWSDAVNLPNGVLGPIRVKPVELTPGTLLAGSSSEHDGWVVHIERLEAAIHGEEQWHTVLASPEAWTSSRQLNDADEFAAIQPTILVHSLTKLQILARSQQGVITQAWSTDGGHSWGPMTATGLPNPSAAIDSVRLTDGRFLLVYNPTQDGRHRLAVAVSDNGQTWRQTLMLEDAPGEYSYPAVIQDRNNLVHVTYTWRRERIRHVVLDPTRID